VDESQLVIDGGTGTVTLDRSAVDSIWVRWPASGSSDTTMIRNPTTRRVVAAPLGLHPMTMTSFEEPGTATLRPIVGEALSRRRFVQAIAGVLASGAVPGCSDLTTPRPRTRGNNRLTARPGEPTLEPELGVVTPLGLRTGRDGLLYVPSGYRMDEPTPLFIALHGAGGSADSWQSYPDRAEAHGIILLALDSRGFTWDLIEDGAYGDDVRFIDLALEYTFTRCRIDPTHVCLGGFSDGASYALSLGVANGDLFSHLVAYSPGFYLVSGSRPGNPRIFVSHGDMDSVLPVEGTRDGIVPALRDQGYDVEYVEFEGDHEVPGDISEAALGWFAA
jgi:phospholipase/carboxylesterase